MDGQMDEPHYVRSGRKEREVGERECPGCGVHVSNQNICISCGLSIESEPPCSRNMKLRRQTTGRVNSEEIIDLPDSSASDA
jgi:hypothetical protein